MTAEKNTELHKYLLTHPDFLQAIIHPPSPGESWQETYFVLFGWGYRAALKDAKERMKI